MRSATFVDRISFQVAGSVAQCAVALGDVDSDGGYELVVGTVDGILHIFKGRKEKEWKRATGLGFITAVGVGDLCNIGHNVLVVASGCGWLYIFDLSKSANDEEEIFPDHKQRVPANIKDLIICDVNADGSTELVVSLTDRVVRNYRWTPAPPPPSGSAAKVEGSFAEGQLVCVNKWEFASQIGTITCNTDSDGSPALLIAQPGGAFMKLRCKKVKDGVEKAKAVKEDHKQEEETREEEDEEEDLPTSGEKASNVLSPISVEYEPLGVHRRLNPNVSAEILGGFRTGEDGPGTRYAIVTLDGSVLLVDDDPEKKPVESIMWNLQVDHQLMCLSKLDVTGNGMEEVIACSWNGQTYIISQDRQAVRFQFEDQVSTFTAGLFTLEPGLTQPVLVYVTFNNQLQVYHNLNLEPNLTLSSLIHYPGMMEEARPLLEKLGCDPGNMKHVQQVYSYCLYGMPSPSDKTD